MTRRVPLSSRLAEELKDWFKSHAGGRSLFSQETTVIRSRTKRSIPTLLTRDEVDDHFNRRFPDERWYQPTWSPSVSPNPKMWQAGPDWSSDNRI